jgi:hypothetical protein
LGLSPTSQQIRELDFWQIRLIYETAMTFPIDGMRRAFHEQKRSPVNFSDEALLKAGYSPEMFAAIRGEK